MISAWTDHLPDGQKDRFKTVVQSSRAALDRLSQILVEREKQLERSELRPEAYNNSNWAYLQAHRNGFKQALNQIQELINLDQKEIK